MVDIKALFRISKEIEIKETKDLLLVLDTSVIMYFFEKGFLEDILKKIKKGNLKVIIPKAVFKEIKGLTNTHYGLEKLLEQIENTFRIEEEISTLEAYEIISKAYSYKTLSTYLDDDRLIENIELNAGETDRTVLRMALDKAIKEKKHVILLVNDRHIFYPAKIIEQHPEAFGIDKLPFYCYSYFFS